VFECGAGRFDGFLHFGGIGFGNPANFLPRGGIDRCEGFAGFACDPAIIDQKFGRGKSDGAFRGR
jgi:hypothetical protein